MTNANIGKILNNQKFTPYRFHFMGKIDNSNIKVQIFVKDNPSPMRCTIIFNISKKEVSHKNCSCIEKEYLNIFTETLLKNLRFIQDYSMARSNIVEMDQDEIEDLFILSLNNEIPLEWEVKGAKSTMFDNQDIEKLIADLNNTKDFVQRWAKSKQINEILTNKYIEIVEKRIRTFTDLTEIEDGSMENIYREIDRKVWLTALKNSDRTILTKVPKGLSKRMAIILAEDIHVHHVDNTSDIELAQQQILEKVLLLAEAQDIAIIGEDCPPTYG